LMTTSSGGNVTTEYVDATNFTFNPSIGMGGLGNGALNVPSMYVHGYLSLADTGSTKPVALEAYPSGSLTFYTGSVENVTINPAGYLGIGIEGTNYSTYAPLYVTNPTGPQVMINANNASNHGLEITYDSSSNTLINNYNNGNIAFGTNNITRLTVDTYGNVRQQIPSSNIHGAIQEVYYQFVNSSGVSLVNFNAYDGSLIGGPSGSGYLEINMNNGSNDQANFLSIGYNGQFGFNQNWGTYGQVFMSNGTASPPVWINVGSLPSIRAGKTEITPIEDVSWMNKLTPVSYYRLKQNDKGEYTDEAELEIDFGLIAEDVEPINPDMCFYKDGKLAGVRYFQLIAPLLKKVQDLEARLAAVEGK